jgi:hypothetical protein
MLLRTLVMTTLPDGVVACSIASAPWERMRALCELHAEAIAAVEERCTLENLADLAVLETLVEVASAAPQSTEDGPALDP